MSLYNMLHGENPIAAILKGILGLDLDKNIENWPEWPKDDAGGEWQPDGADCPAGQEYIKQCIERQCWSSGRYRDIYLNETGTEIILYTRNGGGNREWYWYVFEILQAHPNYLRDYDDDYDCTYAYIVFSVPDVAAPLCQALATGEKPQSIHEKFTDTISEMENMTAEQIKQDKRFQPFADIMKEIMEK